MSGPVIVERGGGGGTAIVAIIVILILVVAGWYFLFGPGAGTQSGGDTNIDVNLPTIEVPAPT
jgi:predicted metalloprotease